MKIFARFVAHINWNITRVIQYAKNLYDGWASIARMMSRYEVRLYDTVSDI